MALTGDGTLGGMTSLMQSRRLWSDPGSHVLKSVLSSQIDILKVQTPLSNFKLVCEHSFACTQLVFQHISTLYRYNRYTSFHRGDPPTDGYSSNISPTTDYSLHPSRSITKSSYHVTVQVTRLLSLDECVWQCNPKQHFPSNVLASFLLSGNSLFSPVAREALYIVISEPERCELSHSLRHFASRWRRQGLPRHSDLW